MVAPLLLAAVVTAANPLDLARPAETVEVPLDKLGVRADDTLRVRGADGQSLPWQLWRDKLLFSAAFGAKETKRFEIVNDAAAPEPDAYPVCNAEFCPERENDFVWENDKFGVRAYGPDEFHVWSGLDVFNKNTSSNVCLKWVHNPRLRNFHKNDGEGMDNYTMGPSRGVGAVAVWADGEWKTYSEWEKYRILAVGPVRLEFELEYARFSALDRMTYRITLDRGQRLFRNEVKFAKKMRAGFLAGPALDVEPARDHLGAWLEDPEEGLMAMYELPKGKDGDEGSTMTAVLAEPGAKVRPMTDRVNCRVFADGRQSFRYWAGASWSLAGEIVTPEAWFKYVREFRAGILNPIKVTVE